MSGHVLARHIGADLYSTDSATSAGELRDNESASVAACAGCGHDVAYLQQIGISIRLSTARQPSLVAHMYRVRQKRCDGPWSKVLEAG